MSIHKIENTYFAGKPLKEATKALVMLHGRGASAQSILPLANHLDVAEFALIAPNATNGTWYPYSFLAPEAQNEPYLSSALQLLTDLVKRLNTEGIDNEYIYFSGFSQGSCLTAEFLARNAVRYGGAFIFTGGVIGEKVNIDRYKGDFQGMPFFIGSGNPDFHVPIERVYATSNIFRQLGADVTEKIYPNIPHTIIEDEIKTVNAILNKEKDFRNFQKIKT